jgi:transaldolase
VTNYYNFCKEILRVCKYPVSLEVFADDYEGMITQAVKLSELSDLVYVKIPISFTNGKTTKKVISELVSEKIKLNVTAVFSMKQVEEILTYIYDAGIIISIFSGRIFDIGYDAVSYTKEISEFIHNESNCKSLWASPRMSYDLINACHAKCDIITMSPTLIKKIALFEKSSEEYSLETVKMFFNDAMSSGYKM